MTLDLRKLTSDVQLGVLRDTRIDAGMLVAPIDDAPLSTLPLLREPLVAVVPAPLTDVRRTGAVCRPLRESSPLLTVQLAWRRDNRGACLATFIAIARAHARAARTAPRGRMS